MEYIISFMETYGYAAMFIAMVLENANIPIPSEIVLGFAGYLISQGIFDLHTTMVVGTLAGIVGSILSYWMGEYGGRPLYSLAVFYLVFVHLSPSRLAWRAIHCGTLSFGLYSVLFLGRFYSYI